MSVAIITEFNPFHNGHSYIIRKAHEIANEPVICIMSGPFVQRGEPACAGKYDRAEVALRCGADAVVELPVIFAVSAAPNFAKGGVEIAKKIKGVNALAFGVETDNPNILFEIAKIKRSPKVSQLIKKNLALGYSYPTSVSNAVLSVSDSETATVLKSPNNVLAIEYIEALEGSSIKPLPIRRIGGSYNSLDLIGDYASATAIRTALNRGDNIDRFLPEAMLNKCVNYNKDLFNKLAHYALVRRNLEELRLLPEVEPGFEYALYEAARLKNLDEVFTRLKTKRYTYARLKRICIYALLDFDKHVTSDIISIKTRVLGIKNEFKAHLSDFSKDFILRNSDIDQNNKSVNIDASAENVYALITDSKPNSYYTKPLIVV